MITKVVLIAAAVAICLWFLYSKTSKWFKERESIVISGEELMAQGDEEVEGVHFVYVRIPEQIMPIERGNKYEDPLDKALKKRGIGEVTGGGTMMSEEDADGLSEIEFVGVDVDLYVDIEEDIINFLKQQMRLLGSPKGTVIEYRINDQPFEVKVYEE